MYNAIAIANEERSHGRLILFHIINFLYHLLIYFIHFHSLTYLSIAPEQNKWNKTITVLINYLYIQMNEMLEQAI